MVKIKVKLPSKLIHHNTMEHPSASKENCAIRKRHASAVNSDKRFLMCLLTASSSKNHGVICLHVQGTARHSASLKKHSALYFSPFMTSE